MRTVTFSDPSVVAFVNRHFVAAWHNRAPRFANDDYSEETGIYKNRAEAFPTKNICTFVVAPDGRVLHYVAGYLSPALFLDFLRNALDVRHAAFDAHMRVRTHGIERAKAVRGHGAWPREAALLAIPSYRGSTHVHTQECDWVIQDARAYVDRVRAHFAAMTELPPLDTIRYAYRYGSEFAEESEDAASIAWDDTLPRLGKMD
jgi:hypothetical protein